MDLSSLLLQSTKTEKNNPHLKLLAIKFKGKAGCVEGKRCRVLHNSRIRNLYTSPCSAFSAAGITGQVILQPVSYRVWATVLSHVSENFTYSPSETPVLLPSLTSIPSVFGSWDCQFCSIGLCCSSPQCLLIPVSKKIASFFTSPVVHLAWQLHLKCKSNDC